MAASAGLGRGTELIVSLPLLRELPVGNPSLPHKGQPDANVSARRILIVDDNTGCSRQLWRYCSRLSGHEVITAYEGQTALALAGIEAPDVVICDISMPGMGGYELAYHLREDLGLRDSLLVALSGYAQDEDRQRSQAAGFNAHLTKPVCLDNLKRLLAEISLSSPIAPDGQATMLPDS